MKRYFVILITAFILTGLLGYPSLSPAQVPPGGKWAHKADMPTVRSDLSLSVVNNLIYAMGGWDGKERLTTVEIYDPSNNTWKKGTDMPIPREQFATAVVNGKIYLFLGNSVVKRRGKVILKTLNTVEVYDPAADAWEQKANGPTGRHKICAVPLNGKVYVLGGGSNVGGGGNLLEIYDLATDKWEKGPKLIEGRWAQSAAALNGKIYVFGGFRKENHQVEIVEEFDPATNQWTKKAEMPTPRYHAGVHAPVAGGKIYLIGGHAADKMVKVVEEYDPAKDRWAEIRVKVPTARMAFDTAVVRGKVYVIGGVGQRGDKRNGQRLNLLFKEKRVATVEEYAPEGWPFAVSPQGKLATTWGTIKTRD